MSRVLIWVVFVSFFFYIHTTTSSVDVDVRNTLINFLKTLANSSEVPLGWDSSLDPCTDQWRGVGCDRRNASVTKLFLHGLNLTGILDAISLCKHKSLGKSILVLDLHDNSIAGQIAAEIGSCKQLTRLLVRGNKLSEGLPDSLSSLSNLKQLDISNNKFTGKLPNLGRIVGLKLFFAEYNQLTGEIPEFDFSNLNQFNVSYNDFSGCIPDVDGKFTRSSFLGNPELYGDPLSTKCPEKKSKGLSRDQILMYSGYAVLGFFLFGFIIFRLCRKKKKKEKKDEAVKVVPAAETEDGTSMVSAVSSEFKTAEISRSEFSAASADTSLVSTSLVVLTSPSVNGLKFEDLLRAPAELLSRGKHGTLYKVSFENGMVLAVKRIKDWPISSTDFKQRMQRMDQVKHPNLLPALAFYCSKHEKLLVYEYQTNGSLYKLLQASGSRKEQAFDWPSRLSLASRLAEALVFTHQELRQDGIAHGNLKSTNILLNKNMEPCISEYGLMVEDSEHEESNAKFFKAPEQSGVGALSAFRLDIHGFGVILLELLTGKVVQNNGFELANWVHSVVKEEWTAEVFDKSLILEGASEARMVSLLQVALKCVNRSAEARPGIKQVATMINTIKEEEDRSIASEA